MKSEVAIINYSFIKDGIRDALDSIDCGSLFNGKNVAIKPNDVIVKNNNKSACTQPDTLQAVIQYVKLFSPKTVTVTGGSATDTTSVFNMLGFDKIIADEGVNFFDHNKSPFQKVLLEDSFVIVNPHIFKYDVLISLAQHKIHEDSYTTLSMKNIAMSYPAADYYGYPRKEKIPHDVNMHNFIVKMCKRFPPTVSIVVGDPVMFDKGPLDGITFESKLVIAGKDFVAVDSVASQLLGETYVPYILQADQEGLGTSEFKNITFLGNTFAKARQIFEKNKGISIDTRAIIMAGGLGTRWRDYLSSPKHLINVKGEVLLHRTVRLLKESGVNDIVIVGPKEYDSRYAVEETTLVQSKGENFYEFELRGNNEGLNTELVSKDKRSLVLLGDVWYSENVMDTIIFGKTLLGVGYVMGYKKVPTTVNFPNKGYPQVWGFSFNSNVQSFIAQALNKSYPYSNKIFYELEDLLKDEKSIMNCNRRVPIRPYWSHRPWTIKNENPELAFYVWMNDDTIDFDTPEQYDEWISRGTI